MHHGRDEVVAPCRPEPGLPGDAAGAEGESEPDDAPVPAPEPCEPEPPEEGELGVAEDVAGGSEPAFGSGCPAAVAP